MYSKKNTYFCNLGTCVQLSPHDTMTGKRACDLMGVQYKNNQIGYSINRTKKREPKPPVEIYIYNNDQYKNNLIYTY